MTSAIAIASNTVREALRERLMYNLVIFALVLIAGSLSISQLTLGEQSRIIADVATGSAQLFGTLIAVFLGVALLARELDRRTCYAVLARPVSRGGFIVGKYLGLLATLAINVAIMAVATAAVLVVYTHGTSFLRAGFFAAFGIMLVQIAVCAAFATLFASFTTATLATIFTGSAVVAGHVFSEVRSFWLKSPDVSMKGLVRVLDVLLPNLGLLDLKEALTYGDPITLGSFAARAAYGAAYATVIVALAAYVFSKRDIR
jgi:ABC-type transport system involved in multi-copper enzyme maturation permease subunit